MSERTESFPMNSTQNPDRLEQAGQILSHLQAQLSELDRREQNLNQQMSVLMEQQRSTQQSQAIAERKANELRQELLVREQKVSVIEKEANERRNAAKLQEESVQKKADALEDQRTQFEREMQKKRDTFAAECREKQIRQQAELAKELEASRKTFEEECNHRESTLNDLIREHEQEFAEKSERFESEKTRHRKNVEDWAKEKVLEKQRLQVERQTKLEQLEADFNNEVAEHQAKMSQERHQLDEEIRLHQQSVEEWETRQKAEKETFEAEMLARTQAFETEMINRTQAFEQESLEKQTQFEAKVQRQQEEIRAAREAFEEEQLSHLEQVEAWELQQAEEEKSLKEQLRTERENFDAQLKLEKETFNEECRVLEAEFSQKVQIEKENLLEERRRLKEELSKELSEEAAALKEARRQLELDQREQNRLNEEWSSQRTSERAKLLEELEDVKKEKLAALDLREKNLQRREIDFEKRTQLHERHLDRVRTDLNAESADLEKQRQKQRLWKEDVERGIRLRLTHMKRFRDLVGKREDCLEEEQNLFAETRRTTERDLARSKEQFLEERQLWLQQRALTTERLQNQEKRLDEEYAALVESHKQVEALSDELEDSLQETSKTPSNQPVQASRHLNGLLAILGRQRREVEQSIQRLQERLIEMRSEGAELSSWLADQDQVVAERELSHQENLESLSTREQEFSAIRDQWNVDRLQAEHIIRDLVTQLEVALDQIARLQSEQDKDDGFSSVSQAA